VPFTSFSEYDTIDGKKVPVWFAADASRPLMAFAGIWTHWTSVRKAREGEITADMFGFLTTEPNAEVGKVHPKAMPVILTASHEFDAWLSADWPEASKLQRPLPDGALQIVASGDKEDVAV
jgi:putative SOS response-associated peptidase YedK